MTEEGEVCVPWNGVECGAGSRLTTRVNKNLVHCFYTVLELKTGLISLNGQRKSTPKIKHIPVHTKYKRKCAICTHRLIGVDGYYQGPNLGQFAMSTEFIPDFKRKRSGGGRRVIHSTY